MTAENSIVINQQEARDLVINYKGNKFFTVVFVKRTNGEVRTMNCRKGVRKNVSGVGLRFDPRTKGLVSVFDIPKDKHRFVSLDQIKRVSMNGNRYIVVNN